MGEQKILILSKWFDAGRKMAGKVVLARAFATILILFGILILYITIQTGSQIGDFQYYFEGFGLLLLVLGAGGWLFKLKE